MPTLPTFFHFLRMPGTFALLCTGAAFLPLSLGAVTTVWEGGSGLWNESDNWSVRVPEPGDTVYFEHTGDTTVTLPGGTVQSALLRIRGTAVGEELANLTLDMGGGTFSSVPDSAANFFNTTNAAQGLVIRNGELSLTGSTTYFLNNGTNPGSLTVESDGILRLNSAVFFGTSSGATMTVNIENGGQVFHTVSRLRGGSGRMEIHIDGADAKWQQTTTSVAAQSTASIGDGSGEGLLRVTNGARFIGNSQINVGLSSSSDGVIEVIGSGIRDSQVEGSSISSVNFYIGGGLNLSGNPNQVGPLDAQGGGNGAVHFLDGGRGVFTNLRVFYTEYEPEAGDPFSTRGSLFINGGQVSVSGSTYFDTSSHIHFGLNSVAQDVAMDVNNLFAGGILHLIVGESFSANVSDTIGLIEYSSLTGTFDGLNEGSVITVGGYSFELSYSLGGDSIIGLTVIPEPGHAAFLIGLALAAVLFCRLRTA